MRCSALVVAAVVLSGCTESNPFLGETEGTGTPGGSSGTTMTTGSTSGLATTGAATGDTGTTTTPVDPTVDPSADSSTDSPTDGGSTTHEPAVCDEATHLCVPAAPLGWLGPVAVLENPSDDATPTCAGDYPSFSMEVFGDLQAQAAECDCDCGAPNNATCSTITVERDDDVSCGVGPLQTWQLGGCSNSIGGPAGNYWRARAQVSGGTCTAMPTVDVPPAGFTTRLTACGLAVVDVGGCAGDDRCIPAPAEPLDGRVCIWQPGDLQCPEGGWTARSVLHEGLADNRGCSACGCGMAQGSCTGSVLATNTSCGAGATAFESISLNAACEQVSFQVTSMGVSGNPTPSNPTCTPWNSSPVGAADPVSPITVCCRQ